MTSSTVKLYYGFTDQTSEFKDGINKIFEEKNTISRFLDNISKAKNQISRIDYYVEFMRNMVPVSKCSRFSSIDSLCEYYVENLHNILILRVINTTFWYAYNCPPFKLTFFSAFVSGVEGDNLRNLLKRGNIIVDDCYDISIEEKLPNRVALSPSGSLITVESLDNRRMFDVQKFFIRDYHHYTEFSTILTLSVGANLLWLGYNSCILPLTKMFHYVITFCKANVKTFESLMTLLLMGAQVSRLTISKLFTYGTGSDTLIDFIIMMNPKIFAIIRSTDNKKLVHAMFDYECCYEHLLKILPVMDFKKESMSDDKEFNLLAKIMEIRVIPASLFDLLIDLVVESRCCSLDIELEKMVEHRYKCTTAGDSDCYSNNKSSFVFMMKRRGYDVHGSSYADVQTYLSKHRVWEKQDKN
jgi:hypothetical protein